MGPLRGRTRVLVCVLCALVAVGWWGRSGLPLQRAPTPLPSTRAQFVGTGSGCSPVLNCLTCEGTNVCSSCAANYTLVDAACMPPPDPPLLVSFNGLVASDYLELYNLTFRSNYYTHQYWYRDLFGNNYFYDGVVDQTEQCDSNGYCYVISQNFGVLQQTLPFDAIFVRGSIIRGKRIEYWRWWRKGCSLRDSFFSVSGCTYTMRLQRIPRNRSLAARPPYDDQPHVQPWQYCNALVAEAWCADVDAAVPSQLHIHANRNLFGSVQDVYIDYFNTTCMSPASRRQELDVTDAPTAAPTPYPTPAPTTIIPVVVIVPFLSLHTVVSWVGAPSTVPSIVLDRVYANSSSMEALVRYQGSSVLEYSGIDNLGTVVTRAKARLSAGNAACKTSNYASGMAPKVLPVIVPWATYRGEHTLDGQQVHVWHASSISTPIVAQDVYWYVRYSRNGPHGPECPTPYKDPVERMLFGNMTVLPVMMQYNIGSQSFPTVYRVRYHNVTCVAGSLNYGNFSLPLTPCPVPAPSPSVPIGDNGFCPPGPVRNMTLYRYHYPGVNFTCGVVNRNVADPTGDANFMCGSLSGNMFGQFDNGDVVSKYLITVNSTWSTYALCNDMSCSTYGGPLSPFTPGRETAYGEGPSCSDSYLQGAWYSLPSVSRCAEGIPVGDTCGWRLVRHIRSVSVRCINQNFRFAGACQWNYLIAGDIIRRALLSDDPAEGGCPSVPLPVCRPFVPNST